MGEHHRFRVGTDVALYSANPPLRAIKSTRAAKKSQKDPGKKRWKTRRNRKGREWSTADPVFPQKYALTTVPFLDEETGRVVIHGSGSSLPPF